MIISTPTGDASAGDGGWGGVTRKSYDEIVELH